MQKLMREYLNELKNRKKRRRRTQIAVVILVSIVVGSVIGALAQYGVAMTGREKCGKEEHQHDLDCYEKTLVCTQPESDGHHHTDACYRTETHLVCGLEESEEHMHSDDCYETTESLICGEEEYEGHHHTDACYEDQLVCGKEVHTHSEECYIDTEADVEDANLWNKQYEDLKWKDTWSENLVMAAREQIGYKESADNYTIAEDGSHKGYTRYGQFAVDTGVEGADVYADWDTAFVNFCLFYSGISATNIFPTKMDTVEWYEEFRKINENIDEYLSCLIAPEGYTPKAGDIVIFQKGKEEEEREYQMGIVSSYDKEKDELKVIEGNSKNEVKENDYYIEAKGDQDDGMAPVFCYVDMSGIEKAYKGTDEAEEDPVEPGEPVEPEEPKDDKTENEEPKDTADTEDPDGKTDKEENPKEETIELTTEVDGTTITLSGPASSFEEGKKYKIQAEKVEDKETIATIEEAIDKEVEKQEKKVENYQAFDIKLILDGKEVQPLGPVEVKFSGKEVKKSIENEETEVNVLHVDENTGEATDMEATPTEEKEVVIETEHFSVYVYVEMKDIFGTAKITVEHWGEDIATVNGTANAATLEDTVFSHSEHNVRKRLEPSKSNMEIYSTDTLEFPNGSFQSLENMSKVCLAGKVDENGEVKEDLPIDPDKMNYDVTNIWICSGKENIDKNKGKDTWEEGTYRETTLESTEQIKIDDNVLIRYWYKPKERDGKEVTTADFYDYDISDGKFWNRNGTSNKNYSSTYKYLKTDEQGINSEFVGEGKRFGIGQPSSGNTSSWAVTDKIGNYFLNKAEGNYKELDDGSGKVACMTPGIVQSELSGVNAEDGSGGTLQFAPGVVGPTNLFQDGKGSTHEQYELKFRQNGDTYTLQYVGDDTEHDYTYITSRTQYPDGTKYGKTISSNDFWPLDGSRKLGEDPMMGKKTESNKYSFLGQDEKGTWAPKVNDIISDDGEEHNYYFGMTYEVSFTVGDYVGPMEYYFRGDDDFWLFVDGKQIVDIGGIHSSIGQTVDLREKMKSLGLLQYDEDGNLINKNKKHTLKVFYMERGATGSCCYMQFTLPQTEEPSIPEVDTKTYTVRKNWQDGGSTFRPTSIDVKLIQKRADKDEPTGGESTIRLDEQNDWTYTWENLPSFTGKDHVEYYYDYEVQEINVPKGYISKPDGKGGLINELKPVSLNVEKNWINDSDLKDTYRPEQVILGLYTYTDGEAEPQKYEYTDESGRKTHKTITLTSDNQDSDKWKGTFTDLPQYRYKWVDGKEVDGEQVDGYWDAELVKYCVREMDSNGQPIENSGVIAGKGGATYKVTYTNNNTSVEAIGQDWTTVPEESDSASLTITNTLLTKFRIIKKGTDTETPALQGAEFALVSVPEEGAEGLLPETKYTGVSDKDGVIQWRIDDKPTSMLNKGKYTMTETKAPVGYTLSNVEWVIEVDDFGKAIIEYQNGEAVPPSESEGVIIEGEVVLEYIYEDDVLYELPSTGGPGIYGYMFSGVLLLAVTALITYRNKRKEVLRS